MTTLAERILAKRRRPEDTAGPTIVPLARRWTRDPDPPDDMTDGRQTRGWRQWLARPGGPYMTAWDVAKEAGIRPTMALVDWESGGSRDAEVGAAAYAWYRARIAEVCRGLTIEQACARLVGIPRPEILRALGLDP